MGAFDVVEERSLGSTFVGSTRDCGYFEMGIDFLVNIGEVAIVAECVYEQTEVKMGVFCGDVGL